MVLRVRWALLPSAISFQPVMRVRIVAKLKWRLDKASQV